MKKLLLLLVFIVGCASSTDSTNNKSTHNALSVHVELGIPKDTDTTDDFRIVRSQYVLSYNYKLNAANWVCWNYNADWHGDEPRCDCFTKDTMLPSSFTSITTNDYTNSGYDRAHLLNSEARTKNAEDNKSTFYMSNIIPQTPDLNRETWASLEAYCDGLVLNSNKELYIIAGGLYKSQKFVNNKIRIPDSCWKVVVVLERGQKMENVTAETPIYAVMMNNGTYTTANNDWKLYKTSVDAIEASTGYNLLSDIPESLQGVIEKKVW